MASQRKNGESSLSSREHSRRGSNLSNKLRLRHRMHAACCKRLWRQRWKRPVAGTYHAGHGDDVATLLSLLAAALRKGQQQCHLPCSVRNQDLKSLLATLGQLRACFSGGRKSPLRRVRNGICGSTARGPGNHPSYPSQASRHGSGPRGHRGLRVLLQLTLLMTLSAITLSSNLSGQLLWQEVVQKARHGPRACSSCLSSTSSNTHRASSTFQMRCPLPPSLNQHHLAPHVFLSLLQQSTCQSSCEKSNGSGGAPGGDSQHGRHPRR